VLARVRAVEELARHESEDRITEELEPLVRVARPLPRDMKVGTMCERQLEQLRVTELDTVVLAEFANDTRLLVRERSGALDARRRSALEQAAKPTPERKSRRDADGTARASPPAAAATSRTTSQVAAVRASVTLWPPNPNEFERAAFARSVRA